MKVRALVVTSLLLMVVPVHAKNYFPQSSKSSADDDYDRLDGRGESGKTVNVIEWAGNLEIHVYPKGSLSGLALTLDKKNKSKPVMVIGYRFSNTPQKQIIRRAILGIELNEGFHAYKDPSAEDYDKIIITNHNLSGTTAEYKLDPAPTQLYPDGHPAIAKAEEKKPVEQPQSADRVPAKAAPPSYDEDGKIKSFEW